MMAAAGAGGGETYWYATIGDSGSDRRHGGIKVVSDGVVVSYRDSSYLRLAKFDSDGAIQFQKRYQHISIVDGSETGNMDVDSSDNIYVAASQSSPRAASITKFNSSGVIQWARYVYSNKSNQGWCCAVSSNGSNVYLGGQSDHTSNRSSSDSTDSQMIKYNSSGTLQWQKKFGGGNYDYVTDATTDSSGNVYAVGGSVWYHSTGNQGYVATTHKLAASNGSMSYYSRDSGAHQGRLDIAHGVHVDSSGNVYTVGRTNYYYGNRCFVVKYNSSFSVQWQKMASGLGTNNGFTGVCTDSSGNVYCVGDANYNGTSILIVKFNSSGVVQWQRWWRGNASGYTNYERAHKGNIDIDSNDNLYLTFHSNAPGGASGDDYTVVVKLPNDGSLTGTHGDFIYESNTATIENATTVAGDYPLNGYGIANLSETSTTITSTTTETGTDSTSTTTVE